VLECLRREPNGQVAALETVGAVASLDRRLDLALGDAGCERDRVLHLLHEVGELSVVV